MPVTGVESIRVDLEGNFASSAGAMASAGDKLTSSAEGIAGAMKKIKPPALVGEGARLRQLAADYDAASAAAGRYAVAKQKAWESAQAEQTRNLERMAADQKKLEDGIVAKQEAHARRREAGQIKIWEAEMRRKQAAGMPADLLPKTQGTGQVSGFSRLVGLVGDNFGAKAAAGLRDGASSAVQEFEKLAGVVGPALSLVGGPIVMAAKVLAGVAVMLAAVTAGLVAAATKFGIEQTSKREAAEATGGKAGYKLGVKLAGDYGLDEGEAMAKVKSLLAAKFSSAEVPVLVKASVGISAAMGDEKGTAFLEKMKKAKLLGPKANEETVKGFAEAGISTEKVYERIAQKLGVTVAIAKAKVKAGMVDMKTALDAVSATADAQFGGIAAKLANTVPGLLARIKVKFASFFDSFNLTPLKGALQNAIKVLDGPGGAAFKVAMTKLGDATIKALFGPFEGPKGAVRLEKVLRLVTKLANDVAAAITRIAPLIEAGVEGFAKIADKVTKNGDAAGAASEPILGHADAIGRLAEKIGQLNMLAGNARSIEININTGEGGKAAGTALDEGMIAGINEGIPGVAAAAAGMATAAKDAAFAALDAHSPSRVFQKLGGYTAQGMAHGMAANDNMVSDAAGDMAGAAVGGAAGALGGAGAGGRGAGGAGGVTIIVNINAPMSPAQAAEVTRAAVAAARAEWLKQGRAAGREAQEAAA